MSETTSIENKINILADFYLEYKGDERFKDFFIYNDLGLPLSYALSANIVERSKPAEDFVEETFALLLESLGVWEDEGFESLDDIVIASND